MEEGVCNHSHVHLYHGIWAVGIQQMAVGLDLGSKQDWGYKWELYFLRRLLLTLDAVFTFSANASPVLGPHLSSVKMFSVLDNGNCKTNQRKTKPTKPKKSNCAVPITASRRSAAAAINRCIMKVCGVKWSCLKHAQELIALFKLTPIYFMGLEALNLFIICSAFLGCVVEGGIVDISDLCLYKVIPKLFFLNYD